MPTAYLSLGSNLGDRSALLQGARSALLEEFRSVRFSPVYETEPVDRSDQPWFLNQVAGLTTQREPGSLLEWARTVENRMGRQRTLPKGPRTLDLDILLYDDRELVQEGLEIPHPRLHLRKHVLVPLFDLAPDMRLPGLGRTVREALAVLEDRSVVRPYQGT